MTIVDVNTRIVGLLGNPLGHSFSPAMHNRAFKTLGLNFFYLPIEVTSENLKDVTLCISKMNFAGYNVTIPHKIRILEYLDHIDELAQAIGAVNTVTIQEGVSTGHNTDGEGYVRSLETEAGFSVKEKTLFILGCGGAARAIAMTLAFRGAGKIFLCNRTEQKVHDLAAEINAKVRPCCEVTRMEPAAMKPVIGLAHVLINATNIGMHPDEDRMPIDASLIPKGLVVSDIVYNPLKTKLLQTVEKKGCPIVPGLGMLVYQGAAAFQMWTGAEPPVDEMFAEIRALKG
ncbi:MAG: shikimate dehydrogenase [Desulfobacterales bacterium]|nr:shikimate dehydrogenase [Desulfobacterales bacterium]